MRNYLVVKLRGIGDAVLATPTIQALKRSNPQARVTVIMPWPAVEVLGNNPFVDRALSWAKGKEFPLGIGLRKERFDCAINLHGNFRGALIGYLSGAKVRIVHDHGGKPYFTTGRVPNPTIRKSAIERDLDAIRALGIPVPGDLKPRVYLTKEEKGWAEGFLCQHHVQERALVSVAIGGSAPSKRWPAERFGQLCNQITTDAEMRILLLTTPADKGLLSGFFTEYSEERAIHGHDLSVRKVAALLRASRLFIGNDSGIKHIACALDTSTLTLFGPEDLEEWHPYKAEDGHEVIIKDVPCRGRGCGLLECEHLTCLKEISVEEVLEKTRAMLSHPVS